MSASVDPRKRSDGIATPSAEEGIYLEKKDDTTVNVCCDTCLYFTDRMRINEEIQGTCRRNAPIPSMTHRAEWPIVSASDWCGEHPSFVK